MGRREIDAAILLHPGSGCDFFFLQQIRFLPYLRKMLGTCCSVLGWHKFINHEVLSSYGGPATIPQASKPDGLSTYSKLFQLALHFACGETCWQAFFLHFFLAANDCDGELNFAKTDKTNARAGEKLLCVKFRRMTFTWNSN